jgi:hypothetical protein
VQRALPLLARPGLGVPLRLPLVVAQIHEHDGVGGVYPRGLRQSVFRFVSVILQQGWEQANAWRPSPLLLATG